MTVSPTIWRRWTLLGVLLAALSLVAAGSARADESDRVLSEEAQECLECHEDESLERDLNNGETLSLNVDGSIYAASVHASEDCTGCHQNVNLDDHPEERAVESREALLREISTSCGDCHSDGDLGGKAVHSKLLGLPQSPACGSCHAVHSLPGIEEWKSSLEETSYCLTCHRREILTTFGTGESFSLTMDEEQLRRSVHLQHDCTDCHHEFSKVDHPVLDFSDRREFSLKLADVCRNCHDEMYDQYEGSIHFSMVKRGNAEAPVCTDCHGSHAVTSVATLETIAGTPCRRCHEEIFAFYKESMHGKAREKTGHVDAPICADCHRAHLVRAASWAERFKDACLSCHSHLDEVHGLWLPNAGLHLDAVACPSCHAPEAERRVDLVLFNRIGGRQVQTDELRTFLGREALEGKEESDDSLSAADLWKYIRGRNGVGNGGPIVLSGQLEVKTGLEAHRLAGKDRALRTCESCHLKGAQAFQTVTISLAEWDGKVRHIEVDEKILGSITSVGSLGGFYAVGSTRIGLLDILLVLAVLGGMSVPAMHMTARLLARQRLGREEK